jgi:hypothetical protein
MQYATQTTNHFTLILHSLITTKDQTANMPTLVKVFDFDEDSSPGEISLLLLGNSTNSSNLPTEKKKE